MRAPHTWRREHVPPVIINSPETAHTELPVAPEPTIPGAGAADTLAVTVPTDGAAAVAAGTSSDTSTVGDGVAGWSGAAAPNRAGTVVAGPEVESQTTVSAEVPNHSGQDADGVLDNADAAAGSAEGKMVWVGTTSTLTTTCCWSAASSSS